VTLLRRSNDVEVSISQEFDKEYRPGETPIHTGIYRCRGCGSEIVAEAISRSRRKNTPGIRPPKGQFDGAWLSLYSRNHTEQGVGRLMVDGAVELMLDELLRNGPPRRLRPPGR